MSKFKHRRNQLLKTDFPIDLLSMQPMFALKEFLTTLHRNLFAHGVLTGRQAGAHCAIAGADKNAVRPAKKQCEMYN